MLFLGLVGLAVIVVDSVPAPRRPGDATTEAVSDPDRDMLVLRFGLEPDPGVQGPRSTQPAPRVAGKPTHASAPPGTGPSALPPTKDDRGATPDPGTAPPGGAKPPTDDPANYYVVQAGDTLSAIAQARLGSARLADDLARLNGIEDPASIHPGQVLRLR